MQLMVLKTHMGLESVCSTSSHSRFQRVRLSVLSNLHFLFSLSIFPPRRRDMEILLRNNFPSSPEGSAINIGPIIQHEITQRSIHAAQMDRGSPIRHVNLVKKIHSREFRKIDTLSWNCSTEDSVGPENTRVPGAHSLLPSYPPSLLFASWAGAVTRLVQAQGPPLLQHSVCPLQCTSTLAVSTSLFPKELYPWTAGACSCLHAQRSWPEGVLREFTALLQL